MKGRADFKLTMQRESQTIKDCLTFSGPPDPLRGEEIYRKYVVWCGGSVDMLIEYNRARRASLTPTYVLRICSGRPKEVPRQI